jgi:hypothetical protein
MGCSKVIAYSFLPMDIALFILIAGNWDQPIISKTQLFPLGKEVLNYVR